MRPRVVGSFGRLRPGEEDSDSSRCCEALLVWATSRRVSRRVRVCCVAVGMSNMFDNATESLHVAMPRTGVFETFFVRKHFETRETDQHPGSC